METPLSSTPAQRVVDRISPTLRHNVNVMDATGLIIASRDTARIGTLHAGARKAAATGTAVLIHRDEEHESGLAGANMPFEIDGRVVGVVGLSGDPATVSPLAEVAALALKLLLEREWEVDAAARRDALARPASPNAAAPLAPPWRLAALLRPPSGGSVRVDSPTDSTAAPAVAAPAAAGASNDVTDLFARSGRYRWASFRGATWVLLGTSEHDAGALAAAAVISGVVPLLGDGCTDGRSLQDSAKALAALAARPDVLPPSGGGLHVRDLAAELAVACMPRESSRHMAARVATLSAIQRQTLDAFMEAGGSVSGAARALFAHRNTVLQRLDRIAVSTGLNPRDPRQALTLRLGLVAARSLILPPQAGNASPLVDARGCAEQPQLPVSSTRTMGRLTVVP